ncbi:hypothetical protein GCM10029976_029600 [Kribbella albertanoniae]
MSAAALESAPVALAGAAGLPTTWELPVNVVGRVATAPVDAVASVASLAVSAAAPRRERVRRAGAESGVPVCSASATGPSVTGVSVATRVAAAFLVVVRLRAVVFLAGAGVSSTTGSAVVLAARLVAARLTGVSAAAFLAGAFFAAAFLATAFFAVRGAGSAATSSDWVGTSADLATRLRAVVVAFFAAVFFTVVLAVTVFFALEAAETALAASVVGSLSSMWCGLLKPGGAACDPCHGSGAATWRSRFAAPGR